MSRKLEVAVFGATGAVGEQLLTALADSKLPIGTLHVYGGPARSSRVDTVSFAAESLGVEPITRLAEGRPNLAFLAVPAAVSARLAPGLADRGCFVIDIGNVSGLDAPLALPPTHGSLPDGAISALRCPSAAGWMLASLLAPLADAGVTSVTGVVTLSAASRGRGAMDELAQQVVANFTQQDPPRRIFPDGLAFDVLPEDGPQDEWSGAERQAAEEVEVLAGIPASRVGIQLATLPLFSGSTCGLHLRGISVEAAMDAWRDAPALREVSRTEKLRPRAWLGRADIGWGRLRADPGGDGVHVWLVADPLVGAGAATPVRAAGLAYAAGLLQGTEA